MKISVITVCYNAATSIERTLRSVREQTHPDVEHIVIDGGSTDGTLAIIERYREGLSHIISEPDKGMYDALNKGIRLARGEAIGLLNADDVFAHTEVLAHVSSVMEQEKLDAVYADVEFFRSGEEGRPVRRYRSQRFRPERIGWGWMPAHPTLYMRRSVYETAGPYRTDLRIAGDFDYVARVFKNPVLCYRYVPEVWVRMQMGGLSTGGIKSTLRLNKEVMQACRDNGISTNWFKLLSKYPYKLLEWVRR